MGEHDLDFVTQQTEAVDLLVSALKQGRLGHGLLFVGPPGSGKTTLSLFLAQRLLCSGIDAPSSLRGCGHCGACHRTLQKTHPDLNWVITDARREGREGNKARTAKAPKASIDHKIDDIRVLCHNLLLPAHEGIAKIAVIVDAHRMTNHAANALLKTLEEPKANTHLILTAPSKNSLLPTLGSRVQAIRFKPLSHMAVAQVLQDEGLSPEKALQKSLKGDGSISQARLQTNLSPEQTRFLLDLLEGSLANRVENLANWGKDRGEVENFLSGMLDTLVHELHQKEKSWLPEDQGHFLLKIIEATLSAQARLRRHGNAKLITEKLFLNDIPVFDQRTAKR